MQEDIEVRLGARWGNVWGKGYRMCSGKIRLMEGLWFQTESLGVVVHRSEWEQAGRCEGEGGRWAQHEVSLGLSVNG